MLDRLKMRIQGKVALIGIGNSMRGDDALGPLLIDRLTGKVDAVLVDAGEVPECYTGRIIDENPDTIILVDAVDLGVEPGSAVLVEPNQLDGISSSTHNMCLGILARYLQDASEARTFLLGIQPKDIALGHLITPEVEGTLDVIEQSLIELLPPAKTEVIN